MSDLPKIVYQRLRAGSPGDHPDPDLLTAFAEQTLTPVEREAALQHLALCEDCRAVMTLALPVSESAPAAAESEAVAPSPAAPAAPALIPARRGWFAWPTLRWAALAAGVVVAGAILMQHSGNRGESVAVRAPAPSATAQPEAKAVAKEAPSPAVSTSKALTAERKPNQEALPRERNKGVTATRAQAAPAKAEFAKGMLADTKSAFKKDKEINELASSATGAAVGRTVPPSRPSTQNVAVANESVEVTTAAPTLDTAQAEVLAPRNEAAAAVRKAKPPMVAVEEAVPPQKAVAPTATKQGVANFEGRNVVALQAAAPPAASAQAPPVQWSLSAGALRRSGDGGRTWESALRADNHLLCYAALGDDIWAGGQAGILFHSADRGTTWTQLHPSIQDRQLASDVTRIEARAPAQIVLSTSSGETWVTSDNGKSWSSK